MGNLDKALGLLLLRFSTTNRQAYFAGKQRGKLTVPLLVLLLVCLFGSSAEAKYGGGSGTVSDPYLIHTAEQMNDIGANQGDWGKHFTLMADIELSSYTGSDFNIIGYFEAWYSVDNIPFNGVFDGNDHTISDFGYSSTGGDGIGLFSYVQKPGQVKNLGLVNPNVLAQGDRVGSLVGYLDAGTVVDCYAKGASVSGNKLIGGLVGSNDGTIVNCYASGRVLGDVQLGGLVGQVGPGTVGKCYATTSVSGNQYVGGLVGNTSDDTSTIIDCYATGPVLAGINVGGLVGLLGRGRAATCYSTGSVSGTQDVGGLLGGASGLATVWNCFWDMETSGQTTSGGGTGKTTAQMQTKSTFSSAGWNFVTVWDICEGTNYPVLRWQIPVGDIKCPDGVNMIDFSRFASYWLRNGCASFNWYCAGSDLDQSGSVDISDLTIFADNWLAGVR